MKKELIRFYEVSKKGVWNSLHLIKDETYKKGSSGDFVKTLKFYSPFRKILLSRYYG